MNWIDKGVEYWAAFLGVTIYVAMRKVEQATLRKHVAKLASSALLGGALSSPVAGMLGAPEILVMVFLVVASHLVLDLTVAILSDKGLIVDLVRGRLGGGRGNG